MTRRPRLKTVLFALGVFTAAAAGLIWRWNGRQAQGKLQEWNLPVADVPGILPGPAHGIDREPGGTVWLATGGGVVRIDQVAASWRIFKHTDGLADDFACDVHVARTGTVWVTHPKKGVSFYDLRVKRWRSMALPRSSANCRSIFEDKSGTLWLYGFGPTLRLTPPTSVKILASRVNVVLQDHQGDIWLAGQSVYRLRGGKNPAREYKAPRPHDAKSFASLSDFAIDDAVEAPDGSLWFASSLGLLRLVHDADEIRVEASKIGAIRKLAVDRSGRLWGASEHALFLRTGENGSWQEVRLPAHLSNDESIRDIRADASGKIWVGSDQRLYRYDPLSSWTVFSQVAGFLSSSLLAEDARKIWIIDFLRQAVRIDIASGRSEIFRSPALSGNYLTSLKTFGDRVWVLPMNRQEKEGFFYGLHFLDSKSGRFEPIQHNSHFFATLFASGPRTGSVWLRDHDDRTYGFHPYFGQWSFDLPFPQQNRVLAVYEDSHGTDWVARNQEIQKCEWESRACRKDAEFSQAGVMPSGPMIEPGDGSLWIGAEGAVVRRNLLGTGLDVIRLPASCKVGALSMDSTGLLWIAMDRREKLRPALPAELADCGLLGYRPATKTFERRLPELKDIVGIQEDSHHRLWLRRSQDSFLVLEPRSDSGRELPGKVLGLSSDQDSDNLLSERPALAMPDSNNAIWLPTDRGLARQSWTPGGVPGRQELFTYVEDDQDLAALSRVNRKSDSVWRSRRTGLLLSTDTGAQPYALSNGFPLTVLEPAPSGGVWIGQALGGLTRLELSGRAHPITAGLPSATVLAISQRPGVNSPEAWVATNDGAVHVQYDRSAQPVRPEPGPVDAVLALPDGGAWLAFNPIEAALFLDPSLAPRRATAFLQRISPDGHKVGLGVSVPRGDISQMALDRDDQTTWIGTTAGLYRLEPGKNAAELVTAGGRLQAGPVRVLTVDLAGTVWLGIDGGKDTSATILGYKPGANDFRFFTPRNGLPDAKRIDALSTTPAGDLVVLAGGQLVKGRVFIPFHWELPLLALALCFFASATAADASERVSRRREEEATYRPLLETARDFFIAAGHEVQSDGYRTLLLNNREPTGKTAIPVRCALGDLLRVEEVIAAFAAMPKAADGATVQGYLVFPHEIDPAAWRQLDVYRLNESTVIIPASAAFLRAKTAQGSAAAREALDALRRRYLSRQDLFDIRNSLDDSRFVFGRRTLLDELANTLSRREQVALVGPRKSGKTSVLNLLLQHLSAFPVVKIDFEIHGRDEVEWPQRLLRDIIALYDGWGRARHGVAWTPTASATALTGPEFRASLEERRDLQRQQGIEQPLIVMLDEIERVMPVRNEGDAKREREYAERFIAAAGILRALGQEGGDRLLSLIVADRLPAFNRINDFRIEGVDTNPFFRFFREFFVPPLDREFCDEMLSEIGHAMGLEIDPGVKAAVFADSGGHPALARQLASAAVQKAGEARRIEPPHYAAGLQRLREESGEIDNFFQENLWRPLSGAERRILGLAAMEEGCGDLEAPGPVPILESTDQRTVAERIALVEARRLLFATGMIEEGTKGYRVRGALFRFWLHENLTWPENH